MGKRKFVMSNKITEVAKDILPDQDIDCVVYGCTSGTIAAGYNSIKQKVKAAKPMAQVTTPSTAAIKALKKLNIKIQIMNENEVLFPCNSYTYLGLNKLVKARLCHHSQQYF